MTQEGIVDILLRDNFDKSDFPYPLLTPECVDSIAETLSKCVYDTFKIKSTTSSLKRINILKFVHEITANEDPKRYSINEHFPLISKRLTETIDRDYELATFLKRTDKELNVIRNASLMEKIERFYEHKLTRRRILERIEDDRRLKLIDLGIKSNPTPRPTFQLNQASMRIIKELGRIDPQGDKRRELRIKLGYSALNLSKEDEIEIVLNDILSSLIHDDLYDYEISFLKYLFTKIDTYAFLYRRFSDDFEFVVDLLVIGLCREVMSGRDGPTSPNYLRLKNAPDSFRPKITSALYELYFRSYCNQNIKELIKKFE